MLVEPLAGRGRLHAARLALEQRHGELGFQIGDVMAERGLRHIGLIRRARQVALLVDGDEIAELAGVHGRYAFYNDECIVPQIIFFRWQAEA